MPTIREIWRQYETDQLLARMQELGLGSAGGRTWQFVREGNLVVATGTNRIYNDTAKSITIGVVRFSLTTAPAGSAATFDLRTSGVVSATGSIAAGGATSTATISNAVWPAGGYLTVDITAIGSTTPGAGLIVQITEAA